MSVNAVIFIDANLYLDLYLIDSGKKLLPALDEQQDYIFVTKQVVDEVYRNKVEIVAGFLAEIRKKLDIGGIAVPDHLRGAAGNKVGERLQKICGEVKATKEELEKEAPGLLKQISQSNDQVSGALKRIFSRAVRPSKAEKGRARRRKECGNPPGKAKDPLGDQITWEQILSRGRTDRPKLWIITKDSDYATKYGREMFLNSFLYEELRQVYGSHLEIFCFDAINAGLKHFAETTGVKADKLPTNEEADRIKKELESLPNLSWLTNYDDSAHIAVSNYDRDFYRAALRAAQMNLEQVVLPPENSTKK